MNVIHHPTPSHLSAGASLVDTATDLPLRSASLRVEARGGIARVTVKQRFENRHAEALHVTYSLPLPADAAVSGFAFLVGDRRVVGEVAPRDEARERFEEALAEGRTAGLLDQERASLFTQELGNIPPGAEVSVEVTLDQRLVWTDRGEWEWRFPTTTMPRYLGGEGRVPDAERVIQEIADGPLPARLELALSIGDRLSSGAPSSPSHAIASRPGDVMEVAFAAEDGARLDRDAVVRWPVAIPEVGAALVVSPGPRAPGSGDAFGMLTLVPPSVPAPALARDLIVLIDTSGSMSGEPLDQARRVVLALVDSLSEKDQLELVEFSDRARRWKKAPVGADAAARASARSWLEQLRAGGSTEMSNAVIEALSNVRPEAQRQVVLVTDGAIGFETEVIRAVLRRLPAGSRLHTVGIGSAVNRSLTAPAARAGHGVEIVIAPGEDVEPVAARLLRRTSSPVVVELELAGSALRERAPSHLPDLFAGAPVLVAVRLDPAGGELVVRGKGSDGARFERRLRVEAAAASENAALPALFARERVEDLELEIAAGEKGDELDARIESLGLEFGIATRLTSWVAVDELASVDPTKPTRQVRQPHELPHGTSVLGLGLRAQSAGPPSFALASLAMAAAPMPASAASRGRFPVPLAPKGAGFLDRLRGIFGGAAAGGSAPDAAEEDSGQSSVKLEGKVMLAKERTLVVSVTVESAFDWDPGTEVTVVWGNGESRTARVIPGRTTAAGGVTIGQTVRFWLEFDAVPPPGRPNLVRTSGPEPELEVRLAG